MSWTSVDPVFVVSDVEASVRWYHDVFGFQSRRPGQPPDLAPLRHAVIARDDVRIHLLRRDVAPHGLDSPVQALFRLDEGLDELFERVKKRGISVIHAPADQPWGHRDFMVADPDGNLVWLAMPLADR